MCLFSKQKKQLFAYVNCVALCNCITLQRITFNTCRITFVTQLVIMGENTTSKSFTLRDVTLNDIDKFTDLKNSKRLTPGGTLNLLLNAFENTGAPSVSTEEIDKLKAQIAGLHKIIEGVNYENTELKEQIEALQSKTPETVEVPIKLQGTQFIFEPGKTLFDHMRRCMVYDIKKGVLKKSDPATQLFTDRALTYYIKNEYNHILK